MMVQKRMITTIVVMALLAIGVFVLVGLPAALSVNELKTEIDAEQAKIEKRYRLRRYIRDAASNLENTKENLLRLRVIAINEGEELKFIQALERAATTANVTQDLALETVNQKQITAWEREVPFKIEVKGLYNDVMRYLNEIEHLPYYVLVEDISITRPLIQLERDAGIVQGSLRGKVAWLSAESEDFVLLDTMEVDNQEE